MRTITSASDVDRLFKQGRRASRTLVMLLALACPEAKDPGGRVLFVAGRKLGGAVMRNRCKRVLREACRRAGGPWPGYDVALIARAGAAQASPHELDQDLSSCLRRLEMGRP